MKERPILFSAPMVRAILDGRKKQTRRVAKLTDGGHVKELRGHRRWHPADPDAIKACPYGAPGDQLWVRETWAYVGTTDPGYLVYRATYPNDLPADCENVPDDIRDAGYRWKPSIHMPRSLSRITLTITDVRVERLQVINSKDAMAEGCLVEAFRPCDGWPLCDGYTFEDDKDKWRHMHPRPEGAFQELWDSINGKKHPWESNPWVWVVEFEREGS